jgi:DNA-binding transcriptional MerR regulator
MTGKRSPKSKDRSKSKLLPIGRTAQKAGISRQSLQYYLMLGLLEPVKVTPTNRRLFDENSVKRIKLIRKLSNSGYPLRAIRELFLRRRTGPQTSKKAFGASRTNLKGNKR